MTLRIALGGSASRRARDLGDYDLIFDGEDDNADYRKNGDVLKAKNMRPEDIVDQQNQRTQKIIDAIRNADLSDGVSIYTSLQGRFSLRHISTIGLFLFDRGVDFSIHIRTIDHIGLPAHPRIPITLISDDQASVPMLRHPRQNPDFFDQLRELQAALNELRREIDGINDPERRTSNIAATRAYIDAFSAFLNDQGEHTPEEVPREIPRGLSDKLRSVNWSTISGHAQKWADTIIKAIEKLL